MFMGRKPGMKWFYRGDPVAADFDQTTLTADNAWHSLSLSAIVPVRTKLVKLRIQVMDNDINQVLQVRKGGQTNTVNVGVVRTQVTNQGIEAQVDVFLNDSLQIDYLLSNIVWTLARITVLAYCK